MTELNYLSFAERDLKEIIEASKNNKLVFFIGSGFSKLCETDLIKIPDWSELINELKEDLTLSDESDYLKIAQLYFLKFGQHAYVNKIKSSIKELTPSRFHKSLFDLSPRYIITTNWDDLIEKTTNTMSLPYYLICSDTDLAQSQLDKKIIKMHGDFKQHNFVFKEDDYLQYSQNFPLIENYIKGIFSTNTIVFLGYSYSDYNLKQIISWITNISKATPQKYLLGKTFDNVQALYLKNHGISLFAPAGSNQSQNSIQSYEDLHELFFNELKTVQNPDELITKIMTWVEAEINKIEKEPTTTEVDKKNKITHLNIFKMNKIINYGNEKIATLFQYKILLPEQISKKFSNCTIDYNSPPSVTLISHDSDLTFDFNKDIREINKSFLNHILNINSSDTDRFVSILNNAFITQVSLTSEIKHPIKIKKNPINIFNNLYKKIYFEYDKNDIEIMDINEEYKEILENLKSKVENENNKKNYVMATIYMANYDFIYRNVKYKAPLSKILKDFSPYDYKKISLDFPRIVQHDIQDLLQILEFNEIYKVFYQFKIKAEKNKTNAHNRRNGWISYSNDEFTIRAKLYSYIYFILGNDIYIENLTQTKQLFQSTLFDSFEHYLIEDHFIINITDLFIIIKYCNQNKIKEIAEKLIIDKKLLDIIELTPKEIATIKKYLLKSLKNICNLMNFKDKENINHTALDEWFDNLLTILGFIKWKPQEFENIFDYIFPFLKVRTYQTTTYSSIQYFLYVNWQLYQVSNPSIMKIIDIMLNKIITNEFNGVDRFNLSCNMLGNVFSISNILEYQYENIELLKLVLYKIKDENKEFKNLLIENLFLYIKTIGTDEVKIIINQFIEDNILNLPCTMPSDYVLILLLITHDYSIPKNFLINLEKFINENIPNNLSDPEIRKAKFESELPHLLKFLIDEKKIPDFKEILEQFENNMTKASSKKVEP